MLRAMIVDDEAPARSELRFLLEQTGKLSFITEAASVRAAIETLMENRVDVGFPGHLDAGSVRLANGRGAPQA